MFKLLEIFNLNFYFNSKETDIFNEYHVSILNIKMLSSIQSIKKENIII